MKKRLFLCLCGLSFLTTVWIGAQVTDKSGLNVGEAYLLRMNGKADQANELLTNCLKDDSVNALAWFEMARTRHHMFLGNRQISPTEWAGVVKASGNAARLSPTNEVYAYYYAYARLFDAFISMMTQQEDAGSKTKQACADFQAVLKINPECSAARLYLIDIYSMLPPEMGGDREQAMQIAGELMAHDKLYGAIANSRLMPDTADFVKYWEETSRETGMIARVMEEIGRAYLLKSDSERGGHYFMEAMKTDDAEKWLIWNLVRYHVMSTQQDPGHKAEHLETASALITNYLKENPDLCIPMKAYANGVMGLIRQVGGDNTGSQEYIAKAAALDPYFSGATGAPSEMLYFPPEKVRIIYSSFFLPF